MSIDFGTFHLDRRFDCPSDRLWHLFTDPQARETWGAPSDDHILQLDVSDLREGGMDRHLCGPKENPEFWVDTRWYRLNSPDIAVFTETVFAGGETISVAMVTASISGDGKQSALSLDVSVTSFVGPDGVSDHNAGWSSALNRLNRLLGTLS